jgi:hydrogenase maturation protease
MAAPVLVFGYGNPSRGDDALGPAFLERLEALRRTHPLWPEVELLTDFQLQVEHALDMRGRERVLLVDASLAAPAPFSYARIFPKAGIAYTTHELTPAALLDVYERVTGKAPPPSFLLGIHGERFELGEPISRAAARNLDAAVAFAAVLLGRRSAAQWEPGRA